MIVPSGGTQTAGGSAGVNTVGATEGATAGQQYYGGSSGACSGSTGAGYVIGFVSGFMLSRAFSFLKIYVSFIEHKNIENVLRGKFGPQKTTMT